LRNFSTIELLKTASRIIYDSFLEFEATIICWLNKAQSKPLSFSICPIEFLKSGVIDCDCIPRLIEYIMS